MNRQRRELTGTGSQIIGIAGLIVIAAALLFSFLPGSALKAYKDAEFIFTGTAGDADCCIMLSEGRCAVIDTGEGRDAEHICSLLEEHGIDEIDLLILSHPDADHIGGAEALFGRFTVRMTAVPYYSQYSELYSRVLDTAKVKSELALVTEEKMFACGELMLTVYPPEKSFYDLDNDYSLVTAVEHGKVTLLLTGDCEKERLGELEDIDFGDVALLKLPYHGRSSNAAAEFIKRVEPQTAVVTAKAPESKISKVLGKLGCEVYSSVGQDVCFRSDGTELTLEQTANR